MIEFKYKPPIARHQCERNIPSLSAYHHALSVYANDESCEIVKQGHVFLRAYDHSRLGIGWRRLILKLGRHRLRGTTRKGENRCDCEHKNKETSHRGIHV